MTAVPPPRKSPGKSAPREALAVPDSRLARFARLGALATGVAGGMLAEGVRQLASGKRPTLSDLLLTPANARRVAAKLAHPLQLALAGGDAVFVDHLPEEGLARGAGRAHRAALAHLAAHQQLHLHLVLVGREEAVE